MFSGSTILTIVPARGGSKGLPGKNVKPLLGKPLVGWTIEQALKCRHVDEVIVSTDSKEIAAVSERFGAHVPFLRPTHLSTDAVAGADVIVHALDWYLEEQNREFDLVMWLEPTSPLRRKGDLDRAVEQLLTSRDRPTSLVSLGEVHMEHPSIVKVLDSKNFVKPLMKDLAPVYQRQQVTPVFFPYGVVYISRVEAFRNAMTFYQEKTAAYHIERWQNYEIDDLYDFLCVEAILKEKIGEVE